jgi:type IV pilus assembly protein PilC
MPLYKYSAIAIDGKKRRGKLEAANVAQLSNQLRTEGFFLLEQSNQDAAQTQSKLKLPEIADFCRQLSAMLSSGITLIRAMTIIAQRDSKPQVKRVYSAVILELQKGASLSESMSKQGNAFPELLVNMIKAGESSGRMDVTTAKMADTYDKKHKIEGKIRSATAYPLFLLALIVLVMIFLFTFVLPNFFSMFDGMTLPLPTRVVLGISNFLTRHWLPSLICVIIGISLILAVFRAPSPRIALDHFKLKTPKVGRLLRTIYTARFARTMASLYVSGIPMIQALRISRGTIGNKYIEQQFDGVISALANGRTLSLALQPVNGFDPKLNATVLIGEESGRLEQMLESVADQFDYEAETATQRLVALLEPMLIVLMAVIVAFIIISVMLPIFQMYSNVETMGNS